MCAGHRAVSHKGSKGQADDHRRQDNRPVRPDPASASCQILGAGSGSQVSKGADPGCGQNTDQGMAQNLAKHGSGLAPDREFHAARFLEVKAAATGKAEDRYRDHATRRLDLGLRGIKIAGLEDHQRGARDGLA